MLVIFQCSNYGAFFARTIVAINSIRNYTRFMDAHNVLGSEASNILSNPVSKGRFKDILIVAECVGYIDSGWSGQKIILQKWYFGKINPNKIMKIPIKSSFIWPYMFNIKKLLKIELILMLISFLEKYFICFWVFIAFKKVILISLKLYSIQIIRTPVLIVIRNFPSNLKIFKVSSKIDQ